MEDKKIVHIEDDPLWRDVVFEICQEIPKTSLSSFENFENFRKAQYPGADLYVLDRHFGDSPDYQINDHNWRKMASTINALHPDSNIVLLSAAPPLDWDWRRYDNILEALHKGRFRADDFKIKLEHYLGIKE